MFSSVKQKLKDKCLKDKEEWALEIAKVMFSFSESDIQ
jgi:hypothetical protein